MTATDHFPSATAGLLLAAAVMLAPAGAASAAAEPAAGPRELVEQTTEQLFDALQAESEASGVDSRRARELVERIVTPEVDFDLVSRWVLGKHWRRASEQQQARFKAEFRTLMVRTYATAVSDFSDAPISYLSTKLSEDGTEAVVRTRVPRAGAPPIGVDYRLQKRAQGWKVFDIVIDGSSLVSTYRTTFAAELQHTGLDGLIDKLAAKNQQYSGG